uniref:Uncharacterized protein n=1 Tax=Nicotiana tabacum TaxID=4097 RepID=A0A1S3Y7H2_TOBAC|nr:PREDICTED: uncharacterized protein LOC107773190 [Nicotiana tabacum]
MMQHGLRCIAFCKTRKLCELVLCYTREILQGTAPHLVDTICAYRAGYVAEVSIYNLVQESLLIPFSQSFPRKFTKTVVFHVALNLPAIGLYNLFNFVHFDPL